MTYLNLDSPKINHLAAALPHAFDNPDFPAFAARRFFRLQPGVNGLGAASKFATECSVVAPWLFRQRRS